MGITNLIDTTTDNFRRNHNNLVCKITAVNNFVHEFKSIDFTASHSREILLENCLLLRTTQGSCQD